MFCKKCGTEIVEGGKFCPKCGATFDDETSVKENNKKDSTKYNKNNKTGDSKKKIVVAIIILVIIVIGVAAWFVFNNNKDKKQKVTTKTIETTVDKNTTREITETTSEDDVEKITENAEDDTSSSFDMSCVESFECSSRLLWHGIEYPPEQIADGSLALAWQEGADGYGEGEYVELFLDDFYYLKGMDINAGYQKSKKLYYQNCRPKEIELTFFDGITKSFTLKDTYKKQRLEFDDGVDTNFVTITIKSVYKGSKYKDTSISEVSFY